MTTGQLAIDANDLPPGTVVGEYVVEKKIGEGGFGTVYKGHHPLIGKQVAVKVLAHHFSAQQDMVSRFISEARAVNQIRNRNIIDIFSFGTLSDGRVYYVMEFLEGQSLEDYLASRGPLSIAEVLELVAPIARALDAAHAQGIAHRDIKPENIFLANDEEHLFPKLLDFGIAKLLGQGSAVHKTQTGAPIGTPHYMSPEQCRGRDVDHRTDFYSFGVMLFRMLVGRVPYDGEDFLTILMKHISDPVPSLVAERPDLEGEPDRVVGWLLQKDAAARPASLREALANLRPGVEKRTASLHPMPQRASAQELAATMASSTTPSIALSSSSFAVKPAKRAGGRGLLLAGGIALVGVLASLGWWFSRVRTPAAMTNSSPPTSVEPRALGGASEPTQPVVTSQTAEPKLNADVTPGALVTDAGPLANPAAKPAAAIAVPAGEAALPNPEESRSGTPSRKEQRKPSGAKSPTAAQPPKQKSNSTVDSIEDPFAN